MRVRFAPRAYNDLSAILDYIDARSPQGARNVKRTIQKAIELIGQAPEAGRLSGVADTRVLPAGRYPYLIYWRTGATRLGSCISVTPPAALGEGIEKDRFCFARGLDPALNPHWLIGS